MSSTTETDSRRSVKSLRWTALLPAAAGVLFAIIAIDRARLPYNSEGRYFDAETSVVYQDGAQSAYGALALCSLALAVALWFGFSRVNH